LIGLGGDWFARKLAAMSNDPVPGLPEEINAKPIAIGAFATKNLIRGELIMLYVDRAGRITADKLEFNAGAPKLKAIE
jgi:hypothetical protein